MTRREVLGLAAWAATARAQNANDRRGAAVDLVFQALEQLSSHASPQDVTRAIRFLRGALDQYPSFGDAHYYRALCLKRLNQDPALQKAEMDAAQRYGSEALRQMRDPFFLAAPKIQDHLGPVGQKWALVVGISRFQPKIGGTPLDNAADDATALAGALQDPAIGRFPSTDHVHCLTNENATRPAILEKLDDIATDAKPEDLVVVYIATHGTDRKEDLRSVAYLYTYDTIANSIFSTALGMVEFSMVVSTRCLAQRTVVILDTCHSGVGGVAASSDEINRLRDGAGRYVLTSCDAGESAYEGPGRFTVSLINRLKGRRGCIALDELYAQVARDVSSQYPKQHPKLAKSATAAEIVLGAPMGGSAGCSA